MKLATGHAKEKIILLEEDDFHYQSKMPTTPHSVMFSILFIQKTIYRTVSSNCDLETDLTRFCQQNVGSLFLISSLT